MAGGGTLWVALWVALWVRPLHCTPDKARY